MRLDINLFVHPDAASLVAFEKRVISMLEESRAREIYMNKEMQALKDQVAKNNDVIESAVTLLGGLKAALDQAIGSGDPNALQELSDALGAEDTKLAEAIAANTPAAPPAPEAP